MDVACAWPVRCVLAFLTATAGPVTDKVVLTNGTAAPEPRLWDFSQPIGTNVQHEIAATRYGAMGHERAFGAPQCRFRSTPSTGHCRALGESPSRAMCGRLRVVKDFERGAAIGQRVGYTAPQPQEVSPS